MLIPYCFSEKEAIWNGFIRRTGDTISLYYGSWITLQRFQERLANAKAAYYADMREAL